jgi:hypothetical protein
MTLTQSVLTRAISHYPDPDSVLTRANSHDTDPDSISPYSC